MATVLVTGGSGFIGSHLMRTLIAQGVDVRVLVRSTSDLRRIANSSATLIQGDVRDSASLDRAVKGVDYVFHLAALTMASSEEGFTDTNDRGTSNMLAAVARCTPQLKRFVLISSQAAAGPNNDNRPMTEDRSPRPISWYGRSKANAEVHVRSSGLPFAIVRPVSVYGEGERDLSRTWSLISAGFRPRVGFPAGAITCVHVEDLVAGICSAAFTPEAEDQTFFLSHPQAETSWSLVDKVANAMNSKIGIPLPVPLWLLRFTAPAGEWIHAITGARPALTRDKALEISQRSWVADPSKAMDLLKWIPRYDLTAGMNQCVPAWLAERKRIQGLAGDTAPGGLLRSILFTFLIGCFIETVSKIGRFYNFEPWWTLLVVLVLGFGAGLGTIAWLARRLPTPVRYILGAIAATGVEMLAAANLLPGIDWTFTLGWPFGIQNDYVRALVVGQAGGVVVLLGGMVAHMFWTMRHERGAQS